MQELGQLVRVERRRRTLARHLAPHGETTVAHQRHPGARTGCLLRHLETSHDLDLQTDADRTGLAAVVLGTRWPGRGRHSDVGALEPTPDGLGDLGPEAASEAERVALGLLLAQTLGPTLQGEPTPVLAQRDQPDDRRDEDDQQAREHPTADHGGSMVTR